MELKLPRKEEKLRERKGWAGSCTTRPLIAWAKAKGGSMSLSHQTPRPARMERRRGGTAGAVQREKECKDRMLEGGRAEEEAIEPCQLVARVPPKLSVLPPARSICPVSAAAAQGAKNKALFVS